MERKRQPQSVGGSASATRIGGCANICGANLFGGNISYMSELIRQSSVAD